MRAGLAGDDAGEASSITALLAAARSLVAALLEEFPEAEITEVRPLRRSVGDDSAAG